MDCGFDVYGHRTSFFFLRWYFDFHDFCSFWWRTWSVQGVRNNLINFIAAHCIRQKQSSVEFYPGDVLAIFGAHNLSNNFETSRYSLSPKRIIKHEDWNPWITEYDADVSLLEFEKNSISFNTFVQPICLLDPSVESPVTGVVTGWGKSEDQSKDHEAVSKFIKVQILSNDECLPGHGQLAEISSERTFCAGLRNSSGVCYGDSGSGLFIQVDNIFHLKGIVSSSLIKNDDCDVLNNAVYTNVLKFGNWIAEKTAGLSTVVFECSWYSRCFYCSCETSVLHFQSDVLTLP